MTPARTALTVAAALTIAGLAALLGPPPVPTSPIMLTPVEAVQP